MKNLKKIIFIIVVVFIITNTFKLLKKEHTIKYKVDKYSISEHFYISKGHYYDIIINDKKNTYIYTLKDNIGKDKKIIKDIKTYNSNKLTCISPVYKKDLAKRLYCYLDGKQVSTSYLQSTNNSDFEKIYQKAKIKVPKNNDKETYYKKLTVYQKNILNNHIYFIWDYKGIYVISKDKIKYKKMVKQDLYDNVMDCVVDKYYALFDNSSVNGIETIYYYDIDKDKVDEFKLKIKLSKDSYINGIVNNLIYVTDRRQKKEYSISIKDETITEVDNDQTSYLIYNNNIKKEVSKSDYFMKDNYFNNNLINDKKVTTSKELKKEYNYYYFIEDNKLYKALDSKKDKRILLAELNNITDWLVKDREIILLQDDTIYSYDDIYGLRKIISTNELRYNYKNIYDLWKK